MMRRKDREVTDEAKIDSIIERSHCCRLGFYDGGEVYIVPLSFGYVKRDGKRFFYFHSASEGRKISLLPCNVGIELDCGYELRTGNSPCDCTAAFSSVIGTGSAEIVTDPQEKLLGLQSLMEHTAGQENCQFRPEVLNAVCVFRVEVCRLSCKENADQIKFAPFKRGNSRC